MEKQSKVLIVDDNESALKSMADVLRGESYQVVTAVSGSEAIDLLKRDTFDLVLTALGMPGVDGFEVLRQAREIAPQAVVLVLTTHASLELAIEAMREGAYDYLVKPCSADELKLKIEKGLERVRLAEERKRAEEALRQRTAQLEALQQVGLEITAELNLDALLRSIASRAVELVGGAAGGLYLYRPDQEVLEWSVPVGSNLAPIGTVLRRGEGLAGKVWETGEPLIVDDYQHWEGRAAAWEGYPVGTVMGAPVRWGGEFLGVLNVHTDTPGLSLQPTSNC
jgi:DNA-binding response OmpR family regulator